MYWHTRSRISPGMSPAGNVPSSVSVKVPARTIPERLASTSAGADGRQIRDTKQRTLRGMLCSLRRRTAPTAPRCNERTCRAQGRLDNIAHARGLVVHIEFKAVGAEYLNPAPRHSPRMPSLSDARGSRGATKVARGAVDAQLRHHRLGCVTGRLNDEAFVPAKRQHASCRVPATERAW